MVPNLSPEDTLLMLSVQVTKDRYLQLAKICDIAEFLRVHRSLNWAQTLKEAKRLGGAAKNFICPVPDKASPGHGTAARSRARAESS